MVAYNLDGITYSKFTDIPGAVYTRSGVEYQQNAAGVLVPFDNDVPPISDGVGLGVWEARTNLLLQSSDFDSVTWIKSRGTVSANAIAAPNGVVSGDKFSEDSADGTHRVYEIVTKSASAVQYTASCYFKAAERTFAQIRVAETGETNASGVAINLTTGEVGTPYGAFSNMSARSTPATDGWFRLEFTFTTLTDASIVTFLLTALNLSSTTPAFVGTPGSGVYVWGAQLEVGAFATPYIPTTSAAATRGAPTHYINAPGLLVPPFTLFAQFNMPSVLADTFPRVLRAISDGGTDICDIFLSPGRQPRAYVQTGGVVQADFGTREIAAGAQTKVAVRFKTDSIAMSVNGQAVETDTSATLISQYSKLYYGTTGASWFFNGDLTRLQIINRDVTDAELQALTL